MHTFFFAPTIAIIVMFKNTLAEFVLLVDQPVNSALLL